MPSIAARIDFRARVRPESSVLSLVAFSLSTKKVANPSEPSKDRIPPSEHYRRLKVPPESPLVVASARNVLSNLRCIGYSTVMCEQFAKPYGTLATVDEELDVPGRSYHVIRNFQGKILAEEYTPECSVREPQVNLDGTAWLVSGTPVLWDGDDNELYDRMITDAADPAHVWRLPRGNHPDASPITRASWNELHRVFVETLANNRDDAAARLKEAAKGLQREDEYLHCVWGVGRPDELIIIIAHGRLEKLGRMAQELGAKRAICVENGGSIAFYYVPTNDQQEWSPLIRAPNLRPAGTAFAFFKLSDAHFACAKR